jgi:hypothetical protein
LTKGNSVELSLNSRVSYHKGYKGRASDQWMSNVLWAAGRAPTTGDHRNIFITLPDGKYQYDPVTHLLSNKTTGSSGKVAFILDYDRERDFDAGVSYMFALLESVSMWNGTGSQLANCPKQESLYFGIMDVQGVTDELYRSFFIPMHEQEVFKSIGLFKGESYPVAEDLGRKGNVSAIEFGVEGGDIRFICNDLKNNRTEA